MRLGSAISAGIVATILAVFIVLLAVSDTEQTGSASFGIVGDVAPQIAGPTIDGGSYDLWEQRGDWVVVNFFASWCIGCLIEHPELVEFDRRHQDDNVQLVSVMFSDTEERARQFFEEQGGGWPALVNDMGSVAIAYSVTAPPETILIGPSGRVLFKWLGEVTADDVDNMIATLSNPVDEAAETQGAN